MTNQSITNFEIFLGTAVTQMQELLKALEEKLYEYPIVQQRLLAGDHLSIDFMCLEHSVLYLDLEDRNAPSQSIYLAAGFKSNLKACYDNQPLRRRRELQSRSPRARCRTVDCGTDYTVLELQGLARSTRLLLRRRFSVIELD